MRLAGVSLCAALGACASLLPSHEPAYVYSGDWYQSGDAATNLIAGGPLYVQRGEPAAPPEDGTDPLNKLALIRSDGRRMTFVAANHAETDLIVQAPGGPLAQTMGFFGDEAPELFRQAAGEGETPFLCGPDGPTGLGLYEAADGTLTIVGLDEEFPIEQREDGSFAAGPVSPSVVCARMRFRKS